MRLSGLAWRGLSARPLRTALTAVGVALGVAVVAATLIANQAADEAVSRAARDLFGRADLRVRAFDPGGFTPQALTTVRRVPGVINSAAVSERRLTLSTAPGPQEQVFLLLVIGVDPAAEATLRTYPLTAGHGLQQPSDILVNAGWAADHHLGLGDVILLTGARAGTPQLRIAGLLADSGFGALAQGAVAVLPRDTLDQAYAVGAPISYVDLEVAPGRIPDVQAALDAQLKEPFVVETGADATRQLARAQASFAGVAFLFGLVSLAVGSFLVANTLAMTLGEQLRQIGLLRAVGATSRQVLGLFLRQGLALGVVGALLGLVAGAGLAAGIIGFLRSTRAVLIDGLPLNPLTLGLALGMGIGVALIGAAIPAVQASRIAPLEAMRPSRQAGRSLAGRLAGIIGLAVLALLVGAVAYPLQRGSTGALSVVVALAILLGGAVAAAFLLEPLGGVVGRPFAWFFGAEGLLGRANLGRDRARTGLTAGALVIGLAAVVALGAVSDSARASADRWIASILPGGYAIRLASPQPIDQVRPTFEAVTGTRVASPVVELPAVMTRAGAQREVSLAGIDPSLYQDAGSLIFTAGDRPKAFDALRAGGAVLVPDGVARRDGVRIGQQLEIGQPGQPAQRFTVAGTVAYTLPARSPEGAYLISAADARSRFGADRAALWIMVPQPGISDTAYRQAVTDTAHSLAGEALTARDLASGLSRSLDRLLGLFDVLALVAVVVAAFGIVNTLTMGVRERRREIAILRANGMTVAQVQAMVVTEAAITGLVGGLLAGVVGMLVAGSLVAAGAAGSDFGAGVALPWPLLASIVLLGTAVASLAAIYPARVAASLPIVPSLTHFE